MQEISLLPQLQNSEKYASRDTLYYHYYENAEHSIVKKTVESIDRVV